MICSCAHWVQRTTLAEYIFIPRQMIYPSGSVTPEVVGLTSGPLTVSARTKIDA